MRVHLLDSLYRRLTARERHRLAIEAIGRGDWDELRRLSDTCPEHRYWAQDPSYAERMKASWLVALMAANFLFRASLALEPAVVTEEINAAMVEALGSEFATAAEELRQSDEAVLVHRLYAVRASNLIGVRDGIERFCDDVGVPAPKLLSLERNCLPLWESASELAIAHASDEATADVVYNTLVASWNAFVRIGDDSAEASARVA